MRFERLQEILGKREADIVEDGKLPPADQKKPKASKLTPAQKATLLDIGQEFLQDYHGEDESRERFQLFLLAASKVL